MSDRKFGAGKRHCDVCGHSYTWGCGHSRSQERDARRHRSTQRHTRGECDCFDHSKCGDECPMAGPPRPGYAPFVSHGEVARGEVLIINGWPVRYSDDK